MESADDVSDILYQDGKWYKWLSAEEAYRIRCDVPLFWRSDRGDIRADFCSPLAYRSGRQESLHSRWWTDFPWYILVDHPNKEEYVPEHHRCDHG